MATMAVKEIYFGLLVLNQKAATVAIFKVYFEQLTERPVDSNLDRKYQGDL